MILKNIQYLLDLKNKELKMNFREYINESDQNKAIKDALAWMKNKYGVEKEPEL